MRIIIFLLVLAFVFFDAKKEKKKQAGAVKKPVKAPAADEALPEDEAIPEMMPDPSPEGRALHDDEGCVGGSIAHDHHEGESRTEHRRHVAAVERREDAESEAERAARETSALNARRLRQAVIMAEVLDRPISLRAVPADRRCRAANTGHGRP